MFKEKGIELITFINQITNCYTEQTNVKSENPIQYTLYTSGRTVWSINAKKWGVIQIYKEQLNIQLDCPLGSFIVEEVAEKLELPVREQNQRLTGISSWRAKKFETIRVRLKEDAVDYPINGSQFYEYLNEIVRVSFL